MDLRLHILPPYKLLQRLLLKICDLYPVQLVKNCPKGNRDNF